MLKSKFVFALEGNIGAGKTTVLNILKEKLSHKHNLIYAPEPVESFKFSEINGTIFRPLDAFYHNPVRYGESFQWWVRRCYEDQLQSLAKISTNENVIIVDRGIYSSSIFVKAQVETGSINELGGAVLLHEINKTIERYYGKMDKFGVDKLYYLDTPIEQCMKNLQTRNRHEETSYKDMKRHLEIIQSYYKEYVNDFERSANIILLAF